MRTAEIRCDATKLAEACHSTVKMLDECENRMVFTGAGVSTSAGVPDLNGADGYVTRGLLEKAAPPKVTSHNAYMN